MLYALLIYDSYKLLKFVKLHTLLHEDVVTKLKRMSYIFTVLLCIKLIVGVISATLVKVPDADGESTSYSMGYHAGVFVGKYTAVLLQNVDLMFAIAFIWMLIFVFKTAFQLKKEQELTI